MSVIHRFFSSMSIPALKGGVLDSWKELMLSTNLKQVGVGLVPLPTSLFRGAGDEAKSHEGYSPEEHAPEPDGCIVRQGVWTCPYEM